MEIILLIQNDMAVDLMILRNSYIVKNHRVVVKLDMYVVRLSMFLAETTREGDIYAANINEKL